MAAVMGAMISGSSYRHRQLMEERYIYETFKPAGGLYTVEEVGEIFDLSEDDLRERLIERSILCLFVYRSLCIPAFQFDGKSHIPHFHDLWDILALNCSVEEASLFFIEPRTGTSVRDRLCAGVSDAELFQIKEEARAYRKASFV